MCGIFGTRANSAALKHVIEGLNDLSYRGYDSWGVSFAEQGQLVVHKQVGMVPEQLELDNTVSHHVIGHTRWSTHGEPNQANAHPHLSYDKRFTVVHNGIIENYIALKKSCSDIKFVSETDSEVVAHLLAKAAEKAADIRQAVCNVVKQLEGRYGLLIQDRESNALIAVRNGSPLVLGKSENTQYISSDTSALARHATAIAYMEDGELAYCDDNGIELQDLSSGETRPAQYEELSQEKLAVSKGDYEHFMRKEIDEQPLVLAQPCTHALPLEIPGLSKDRLCGLRRIIIIGCGTSWHAGLVAEYWMEQLAHIPVEVEYASEFRYRSPPLSSEDCIIAISQSGETADSNAAVELAKEKGATIIAVCNTRGSTLHRLSDACLFTHAGPEIGVASTKAFTTQLTILYQLALALAVSRETLSQSTAESKQSELRLLPQAIEACIAIEPHIVNIAKKIYQHQHALFLGRGLHFPIALEAALKLKEVSYIHAEGYPAAEMKHGPIALIDKDMPVFFIANKDDSYQKIRANIAEVKSRGGYVVALANEGDDCIAEQVDDVLWMPEVPDDLAPVVSVVPFQLLSYHAAKLRECNIDKPRNLAKSVTVE